MEFSASLGKRIKDKRQSIGLKQKELAKRVGISPSYLNLIESNQRRIGGKLVLLMAEALSVDPSYLSRGAEQVKISKLEEIARLNINNYSDITMPAAEFASKFPSWVDLLISLDRKAKSLEALIETLNDRVAHDPHLAASLHEVLTTISAIKSASEILKNEPNLESKWQHKFNQNIFEDSNRLAEGAQLLVNYLDKELEEYQGFGSPQEEFYTFLAEQNFYFSELEKNQNSEAIEKYLTSDKLNSSSSKLLARDFLNVYASDASVLDESKLETINPDVLDLLELADKWGVSPELIIRRLAFCNPNIFDSPFGLVVSDRSGSFLLRKPISGFHIPRFGSGCSVWPLFEAQYFPQKVFELNINHTGREGGNFKTFSFATQNYPKASREAIISKSYMLIKKENGSLSPDRFRSVGSACRICKILSCQARRETSIYIE